MYGSYCMNEYYIEGLVQDCSNSIANWSYCSLALSYQHDIFMFNVITYPHPKPYASLSNTAMPL